MFSRRSRLRKTAVAFTGLLVVGLSAACAALPGSSPVSSSAGAATGAGQAQVVSAAPDKALAAPTQTSSAATSARSAIVKRDSLTETLSLDGTVVATSQQPLMYPTKATVQHVNVKPGQSVKAGDSLVDFDAADANQKLDMANVQLQNARTTLAQAQAAAAASSKQAIDKAAADQQQWQQASADAQTTLSRAQDNLRVVQAGKTPTQREVANTAVTYYGQTSLAQAQDALNALLAGPDQATIQAAQRDQMNAQVALQKAQTALDSLTRGADPSAVRDAQLTVDRAQSQLQIAQSAKPDPKLDPSTAKVQHDAAVQDALLALNKAQTQLAALKQPPSDVDVQSAQAKVVDAQSALSAANQKLANLQAGPDQTAVDAAQRQVEYAKHTISELQATADEVNSHPTPQELQVAQDQVTSAQRALDNLRNSPPSPPANTADLSQQLNAVSQAQDAVNKAGQVVEATHLRAPSDGVVVSVKPKAGDIVDISKPVVVLGSTDAPIVRIDLDDSQIQQVAVGQQATIDLGLGSGQSAALIQGLVASVTPPAKDGSVGAQANLQVTWPDGSVPRFGTPVTANVTVDHKDGVLVVPKAAVHTLGDKSSVEVQDGTLRRVVQVHVGIMSTDLVEIVGGLSEGQTVLLSPTVS